MDHNRPGTNGWNDKEYDDSSNSNSLDGACLDDNATTTSTSTSTVREKSNKLLKIEMDIDGPETASTSRRKRNRAIKAIITDDGIQSDDEKSLNICWNADDTIKIKEEIVSPIDDTHLSDSASNQTIDTGTQVKVIKTENIVKEEKEKRTRASANEHNSIGKIVESKAKSKLSSSHCKYCFKKFSNASNLRRHITMSHFGPKKFTCNLCTFRARRKIDILSHVRTKHEFGGERSDALKFVTINDEPAPKPPPQSTVNRRKEKHTEVLRDDEEEMFIDTEVFIVEDGNVLGTSNENSNADMDDNNSDNHIEQSEANKPTIEPSETNKPNACSKRKGRPKMKDKLKNLTPSNSLNQKIGESLPARRPIRNRIMPVKKDFVYDLSTLLKKDYKDFQDETPKESAMQLEQPQSQVTQVKSRNVSPTLNEIKTSKRRQTLPNTNSISNSNFNTDESESYTEQIKEDPQKLPLQQQQEEPNVEQLTNPSGNDSVEIKGAANTMAQQAVKANRAVFFKPPELPAERPVAAPQRQFDTSTMKDWPILKRPPAIYDGIKPKLSNLKVPGLKRKKRSCLLKHLNTNYKNRFYDKHKIGLNGHTENKCNDFEQQTTDTVKISSKLANKIQLKCAQIDIDNTKLSQPEVQHPQSVTSTNSLSPTPNKHQPDVATTTTTPRRMTLLERLAENKTKKLNESLSRMTIANSDNDSDED